MISARVQNVQDYVRSGWRLKRVTRYTVQNNWFPSPSGRELALSEANGAGVRAGTLAPTSRPEDVVLQLPKSYVDEMVKHALEDDPDECCGIIAGRNGKATRLYRMTNVERSPYRYSMDAKELFKTYREIEDSGWELMVIYHSHTHTEAYPSATDVRLASWPEAYYVLVSLMDKASPAVRSYRVSGGRISPVPLEVVPDAGST